MHTGIKGFRFLVVILVLLVLIIPGAHAVTTLYLRDSSAQANRCRMRNKVLIQSPMTMQRVLQRMPIPQSWAGGHCRWIQKILLQWPNPKPSITPTSDPRSRNL